MLASFEAKVKAWFPYSCICRVCRTKKIHRTDTTLWKPPVQMLNTTETRDTTCCTSKNEFYLSYEFFSFDRHDRYNDMETRLKFKATVSCPSMQQICQCGNLKFISAYRRSMNELSTIKNVSPCRNRLVQVKLSSSHFQAKGTNQEGNPPYYKTKVFISLGP